MNQKEYKEQKGWGIIKPTIDLKAIAPLCRHSYHGHPKGCFFCKKKKFWYDIIDPEQSVWALYFSMNLEPLWTKLKKKFPWWTKWQVQNNRYWVATKKKKLRELESKFLESHPGPWCRALNRAPGHVTYTFGIHYTETMKQIGVNLQWPPEPHPITVQFLGRPKPGVDLFWANFILSEETIKRPYKKLKPKQETDQEYADLVDMAYLL